MATEIAVRSSELAACFGCCQPAHLPETACILAEPANSAIGTSSICRKPFLEFLRADNDEEGLKHASVPDLVWRVYHKYKEVDAYSDGLT